jgi:hypothetical protein
MLVSFQNLGALRAKHGEVVTIPAEHGCLVLHAGGDVALVQYHSLRDDGEGQFHGGASKGNRVDPLRAKR